MPREILFKETYGDSEREVIFVNSTDDLTVTRVEPHLQSKSKTYGTWILTFLKEVFLPAGYPESVHSDYVPYQIWDTVQAFASTIMGTLTTHSIMQGVGVGKSSASALAAAITWILKDGTGMIGRIVFAWWNGHGLDAQCKKWRLCADILNDCAMGIELTLPYFSNYSLIILCISTALKSVVGVAGSATRAALTQHQALQNNLADVSAKDGSQETFVNLIASFVGILILSNIGDGRFVMELFVLLATVHMYANYRAVKALRLNSLNEDRLALILRSFLTTQSIPNPLEVNRSESVVIGRNVSKDMFGFGVKMGVSLESVLQNNSITPDDVRLLSKLFQNRKYLIVMDVKRKTIFISIARNATPSDLLQAYFHACLCSLVTCMTLRWPIDILLRGRSHAPSYPLMRLYILSKKYPSLSNRALLRIPGEIILATNDIITKEYQLFEEALEQSVWRTEVNLLPAGQWRGIWNHHEDNEPKSKNS
ncbi:RUS family member 1 [Neodiprion fabricii]|uniref:RUS family member 1 n=1 Tax=Neodiprion fabricii TaxID=2872261 RepID=UPI001ED9528F|nr:RUS family member 1 [Neodiprion fabricii]